MIEKVIVFGFTDYSRVVATYFNRSTIHEFVGYAVDDRFLPKENSSNHPIFSFSQLLSGHPPDRIKLFSSIGYREMRLRELVYDRLIDAGYRFTSLVCENVYIGENVTLGDNTIVMPGTTIESNVKIGVNNTIWSNSTICHDTTIGNHNFIAANSVLGGGVKIASGCFIGFSSTVLQNISIADETLLGACSLTLSDTERFGKYLGNPAKIRSKHENQGIQID